MPPELVKYLSQEAPGKFHDELLQRCKDRVKMSRDQMQMNYDKWDKYDMVYRGERYRDHEDVKAAERKEPEKMVVPFTFSQIETFKAFCFQVYTQRPTIFELEGTGAENAQAAKLAESILEQNLEYNKFRGDKVQQFLTNIARFGLGVMKLSWDEVTQKVEKQMPQEVVQADGVAPVMPPTTTQVVDEIVYQGNKLTTTSPYRWFPDPRVPMTRFQEGEFCASEDDYSRYQLQIMESKQFLAGVKYIPKFKRDMLFDGTRRTTFQNQIQGPAFDEKDNDFVIITEVQIELIPAEWKVNMGESEKPLGTSKTAEKYVVWVANDNRIVRIEPMGYLHNHFTYVATQFANDDLRHINFGISELLEQLQDIQTWFINSHITNVRKVIQNQLIVDPRGVEMKDLSDRNPIIRLKPSVQGSGVDRWVKQLQVQDVTGGHVNDAALMENFGKSATGITETMLGQFASGRRSAREAGNVANSAAARLLLVAHSIWDNALLPMGRDMLANIRDGMSVQQLVRVVGMSNAQNNQQGVQQLLMQPQQMQTPQGPQLIPVDKTKLAGNYDFQIFDGTLPSQRAATAQTLQELLQFLVGKPEAAFIFGINPVPLLQEILQLRGIRNTDRFNLTPDAAQQLIQLAGVARNAVSATTPQGTNGGAQPGGNPPSPR